MWRHAALVSAPRPSSHRFRNINILRPSRAGSTAQRHRRGGDEPAHGRRRLRVVFQPHGEGGAAAPSTVEFAGWALPQCEFLLASQDRDKGAGALLEDAGGPGFTRGRVFDGGVSRASSPPVTIATLASLGYKPGSGSAPSRFVD